MYARVVADPWHPGQLALQYWFFYVFNDFNDKHEGDWEMIQLDLPAGSAEQALSTKPSLVGYSQHTGAESAHWGDSKLQIVDGTHPVVYPALGSHANYYGSHLHLGRSAAQGVGCDNTIGPSRELRPKVALVPTDRSSYLTAFPWLGYEGHWGEEHAGFYNGPTGPSTKQQWDHPITWADTDWRDTAYTVPAGGAFGSTATDFFCGAVATGSNVLTALVRNPTTVLIVLAVIAALALWLASRTRWEPAEPLPVRRYRRWGAIVRSARRLYWSDLRLFLGLGLLFLPLGLLITGVQYLIFRVGGLSPLVSSAGAANGFVAGLAFLLGVLLTVVGLAIVQAATAFAIASKDEGPRLGAVAAYRKALEHRRPLFGAFGRAAVVIVLLTLTGFGAVVAAWLLVRWSLLAQVVALEDQHRRKALRRSARLVSGSWCRVASLTLFVTTIGLMLGPLVGTIMLFITSASLNVVNLVSSVIYAVALPYVAIATTYLYFDLVVQEHGEAAAETEPAPAQAPLPAPS
jgi:hypothetical protein